MQPPNYQTMTPAEVTTLRDPIARVVSLFYYDGPGAKDPSGANTEEIWTACKCC